MNSVIAHAAPVASTLSAAPTDINSEAEHLAYGPALAPTFIQCEPLKPLTGNALLRAHAFDWLRRQGCLDLTDKQARDRRSTIVTEFVADPRAYCVRHGLRYSKGWLPTDAPIRAAASLKRPKTSANHRDMPTAQELLAMSAPQAFLARLPEKPYATQSLSDGLMVTTRDSAQHYRHVQATYSGERHWFVVLDLDWGTAAADALGMQPRPNVIIGNPANGHAHVVYILATPVYSIERGGRSRPVEWLEAIRRGLTAKLGGDNGYVGLIVKNPLHPHWRTVWHRAEPYSLKELDGYLTSEQKRQTRRSESVGAIGRNTGLFDTVRTYAYSNIGQHRAGGGTHDSWRAYLEQYAIAINGASDSPLGFGEVRATVKSVTRFTWARPTTARFQAKQKYRATIRSERNKALAAALGDAVTAVELASVAGISKRQAEKYVKRSRADYVTALGGKRKPWESLGVSKATYYRDVKNSAVG